MEEGGSEREEGRENQREQEGERESDMSSEGTPHLNRGPNSAWGQVICKTGGVILSEGTPNLKNRVPNSIWGQVI